MNAPSERDTKRLYALSLNQCAFPDCIASIVGLSDELIGEVCHIKSSKPGGPRYDSKQSETERHNFDNLILLCRNHHKVIDDNVVKYPAEILQKIKHEHEANGGNELSQRDAVAVRKLFDAVIQRLSAEASFTTINQNASGSQITQIAGDYHHYDKPRRPKIVITPPEGAVSPGELHQIDYWIESLVEITTGLTKDRAFGMWRNRFKRRFKLTRSEQLLSSQMPDVEEWYRQQAAILKRKLKTKMPDAWRNNAYAAIHMAIAKMRTEKLPYYAQVSTRLKMKTTFSSLKQLTKTDLQRVYDMALRDARNY